MSSSRLCDDQRVGHKYKPFDPIGCQAEVSRHSLLFLGAFALSLSFFYPSGAQAQSCSPPAVPTQVAANGCAATVNGGSFTTTANSTPAFIAQNGGSITTTAPVILTTSGALAFTAQVLTGGTITLVGGSSVTSNGAGANKNTPALRANGLGSSITATNTAVATNGGGAYAVIAENNGAITLHGGTVDTFNTAVHAAGINTVGVGSTIGAGATITADQGLIIRATDIGAYAQGGTINLDTVTVTERATLGNTSGLRADTSIALGTAPGLRPTARFRPRAPQASGCRQRRSRRHFPPSCR